MESYSRAAMEREREAQQVILQAMAKKITWWQAAEILGPATGRCGGGNDSSEEFGFRGLCDPRRGKPSHQRVAGATLEPVSELSREKCFDLILRHFHEKLPDMAKTMPALLAV